jgi:hypothetical protein
MDTTDKIWQVEKTPSEFDHPSMTRRITYQYNLLAKFGSITPKNSWKVVLGSDKDLFFSIVHLKIRPPQPWVTREYYETLELQPT